MPGLSLHSPRTLLLNENVVLSLLFKASGIPGPWMQRPASAALRSERRRLAPIPPRALVPFTSLQRSFSPSHCAQGASSLAVASSDRPPVLAEDPGLRLLLAHCAAVGLRARTRSAEGRHFSLESVVYLVA